MLTAAELMNAFARDRVWAIEWQWTAYWSNAATYVVVPMAGAIAAGDSVLYRRRMTADLVSSQTSMSRAQAARVLALALWAVSAHLVGVLACGANAAWVHHAWHLPWLPVLPAVAAVLAAVTLGSTIGWYWPSLAAPPVVGLTWLALLTVVVVGRADVYLRVDAATGDTNGLRPHVQFVFAATLWWSAVALAALWLLVRRRALQAFDLAPPALVAAAAIALHLEASRPFDLSHLTSAPVCAATRPVLCVNRDYQPRLAAYAKTLAILSRPLSELDPHTVPTRFEQAGSRVAGSPPLWGVGVISVTPSGPPDATFVALDLAKTASGCADAPHRGSGPLWENEYRLADWLLTSTGLPDDLYIATGRITTREQALSALAAMKAAC